MESLGAKAALACFVLVGITKFMILSHSRSAYYLRRTTSDSGTSGAFLLRQRMYRGIEEIRILKIRLVTRLLAENRL